MADHSRERLEAGRSAFGALMRAWHERNGWSHRVLPLLCDRLDLGRLHGSQLSNLRNLKLASPGPEVFLALGAANGWLAQAAPGGRLPVAALEALTPGAPADLVEALQRSALALADAEGCPLGAGTLLEIFGGLTPPPPGFDLRIAAGEAPALSAALAELLAAGQPWRRCREAVIEAYPVSRRQRRERFTAVMAGLRDYSAAELDEELSDLLTTHRTLMGPGQGLPGVDALLDRLRGMAEAQSG